MNWAVALAGACALVLLVSFFAALADLAINILVQRAITGQPRRAWSGERVLKRRRLTQELLGPAVIAFLGAIACNVGTSLVVAALDRDGIPMAGIYWLAGGLVFVLGATVLVLSVDVPDAWGTTTTFEALLLAIQAKNGRADAEFLEAASLRFNELLVRAELNGHKQTAGKLLALKPEDCVSKPRWGLGPFYAVDGRRIPVSLGATGHWAVTRSKGTTGFWTITLVAWIIGLMWVVFDVAGTRAYLGAALGILFAGAVGLGIFVASMRLDLIWWSRSMAESRLFAAEIAAELKRMVLSRKSNEDRRVTLWSFGPMRVSWELSSPRGEA